MKIQQRTLLLAATILILGKQTIAIYNDRTDGEIGFLHLHCKVRSNVEYISAWVYACERSKYYVYLEVVFTDLQVTA